MIRIPLLAGTLLSLPVLSVACECAIELPPTFCETLDPGWSEPHAVVLGVKLGEVYYGMQVKVLEVFNGDVAVGDTLTVWGDNGALCRWYVGTWNNGDTVVWGFHETDFLGNEITAGFPPDLEQPGDYHISNCGTYWLSYANGLITGPIAPGITSMTVPDFWPAMVGCAMTSIGEIATDDPLIVRDGPDGPWLSLPALQRARLVVTDALGRSVIDRDWDGAPIQLAHMAPSTYTVQVWSGERRWTRSVVVP